MYKETNMFENKVIKIIHQSNLKKEDLEWLKEYRNYKIRFLEIQGSLLSRDTFFETLSLVDLIEFKLYFHSLEKMN